MDIMSLSVIMSASCNEYIVTFLRSVLSWTNKLTENNTNDTEALAKAEISKVLNLKGKEHVSKEISSRLTYDGSL